MDDHPLGEEAVSPAVVTEEAARLFGAELRRARGLRGLSLAGLCDEFKAAGRLVGRGYLANVERGVRLPADDQFAPLADAVLDTRGHLTRLWTEARKARTAGREARQAVHEAVSSGVPASRDTLQALRAPKETSELHPAVAEFAVVARTSWPGTRVTRRLSTVYSAGQPGPEAVLRLPGGEAFVGAEQPVRFTRASSLTETSVRVADEQASVTSSARRHGLVVGAHDTGESTVYYAADAHRLGLRVERDESRRADVSVAYRVDNFTIAALWAMWNLDDALLDDDAALDHARRESRDGAWAARHEVDHDEVSELSPVSRMWLGSEVCARHITGHLDELTEVPLFWTREGRGEDASTWLFFAHKLDYLRATSAPYRVGSTRPTRVFCVPEALVVDSSYAERLLLLLSAALMEAHGITVQVTPDPDYRDVPGFVSAASGPALIATWVRADQVWHTDTTTRRAITRELSDTAAGALDSSVVAADAPLARLERLAYYLGLDWRWVRHRAVELTGAGWDGLLRPRSRLLTVTGLDTACRYLAA